MDRATEARDKLIEHQQHIQQCGEDLPKIPGWRWGVSAAPPAKSDSTSADNL